MFQIQIKHTNLISIKFTFQGLYTIWFILIPRKLNPTLLQGFSLKI